MNACDPTYEVRYGVRGQKSAIAMQTIQQVEWGRRLDDISKGKVTHILNDMSCCDELSRLEPWSDTVEIHRNGNLAWMGWITGVEYSRSSVVVEASDALIWSRYRILNGGYEKTQDSAEHFRDIWNASVGSGSPSPIPIDLNISLTGIVENRRYLESYKRIAWFIIKELIEGSLDITALGNQIYAGALSIGGVLNLGSDDFAGDIVLRKAGELYANQVLVEGARQVQGQFPAGTIPGDGIYPLVQDLIYDEAITSAASAAATAQSRYEYTAGVVPRIVRAGDALQLRQGAIDVEQLIPSRIINLDTTDLCYSQSQQFRLGGVDVTYSGGIEQVGISLQPIGTLARLEGITADDDRGAAIDDTTATTETAV